MSAALNLFTGIAVVAGAFFFLAGTAGLLRFPDSLTRLHALTKADNLGLGLVVIGLLLLGSHFFPAINLAMLWPLLLIGMGVLVLVRRN